ncbi:hypothetical protein CU097_006528 [Rhizopus azygosporus]|uniref:RRM domain-containing protein n=1 Tax=Rhizopus azygosporus TaxID=86630 RepID=A0A367JHC6_RHIAZ|nr:hypothetical protein CU097_006528 [Rhizopus azygosporus]
MLRDMKSDHQVYISSNNNCTVKKKADPTACVFVARNISDNELNRSVFDLFRQYGRLLNVKTLRDWMGRPYAFVQFENVHESKKALKECQGIVLHGRHIRCEPARVNRTLCLISLHLQFDEHYLRSKLSVFGDIEDVIVTQHPNFHAAFIQFQYRDDAIHAYSTLKNTEYQHPWLVHWSSNVDMNNISNMMTDQRFIDKHCIYVGNLNESVNEESLIQLFNQYGTIVHTRIIRKYRGNDKHIFAFIKYQHESEAANAIQNGNGRVWNHSQLYVCYRKYSFIQTISIAQQSRLNTMFFNPYYYLPTSPVDTSTSYDYYYSPHGYYLDTYSPIHYVYLPQY